MLIIVTYYMFAKDYKSVAQSLLLYKQFPEITIWAVYTVFFRILLIVNNEILIFWIIVTVDLDEEGGYGLIKDFASTMIICRMDEMIFHSAGIHSLKERFDEIGRDDLDNS